MKRTLTVTISRLQEAIRTLETKGEQLLQGEEEEEEKGAEHSTDGIGNDDTGRTQRLIKFGYYAGSGDGSVYGPYMDP